MIVRSTGTAPCGRTKGIPPTDVPTLTVVAVVVEAKIYYFGTHNGRRCNT